MKTLQSMGNKKWAGKSINQNVLLSSSFIQDYYKNSVDFLLEVSIIIFLLQLYRVVKVKHRQPLKRPECKKKKSAFIINIFLTIIFSVCFGCSIELSHWDGSFEYPQHIFGWEIRKIFFGLRTLNLRPEYFCFYKQLGWGWGRIFLLSPGWIWLLFH